MMTYFEVMLVGLGGFFGAVIRYFISKQWNNRDGFPVGTFFVNIVGSFLIGFIFGLELEQLWTFFLVSGLLGALTTFSTLQKELFELWSEEKKKVAIVYALLTYAFGIVAAMIGYYLT